MVYIYKKQIGTKNYYYLRASEKNGNKIITKDIAYLGNSIDKAKISLDNLKKYKNKIRKAYKTIHEFLESNYYLEKAKLLKLKKEQLFGEKNQEIEACRLHYLDNFQKLDDLTKSEILKNFIVEFAFNSTSIEGNTIKLEEARNILEEGITPKNKTLREIYDIQNTEKAFLNILESKMQINHELIIKLHSILTENIDIRRGYRTTDVRVIKANFKATPAPFVKTDMDLLLKWYLRNENTIHPLILAIFFHHQFEKIHPFMDGNGRVGRMLLNYILIKKQYPPMIVHNKNRQKYLEALRNADKSGLTKLLEKNYFELIGFMADEFIESYWAVFL